MAYSRLKPSPPICAQVPSLRGCQRRWISTVLGPWTPPTGAMDMGPLPCAPPCPLMGPQPTGETSISKVLLFTKSVSQWHCQYCQRQCTAVFSGSTLKDCGAADMLATPPYHTQQPACMLMSWWVEQRARALEEWFVCMWRCMQPA
jgi:hypothetical protein